MRNSEITTILASGSPRRLELLNLIGIYPVVEIPRISEQPVAGESPAGLVTRLAAEKGQYANTRENSGHLIISADTIVLSGKKLIGKPSGKEDAASMLNLLSGKTHKVITGISLLFEDKCLVDKSITDVTFSKLSRTEIDHYLETENYMDKAGAYAIQGKASLFVERINGCFFNVMGFPLNLFYSMIRTLNIPIQKISGGAANEGSGAYL